MKGNILEIRPNGSWESQYGEMFVYFVKIDADGIPFEGQANAKSGEMEKLPYKIGDEVEFEHTESENPQYPPSLKIKKEGSYQQPSGKSGKGSNASFALSYAKDIAVAKISLKDAALEDILKDSSTEDILKQAEEFLTWLNK